MKGVTDILVDIVDTKKRAINALQRAPAFDVRYEELKKAAREAPAPRGFAAAVIGSTAASTAASSVGSNAGEGAGDVRVIAEVKKASPSKGIIREDFDPVRIARDYEAAGAVALSVLTEEKYFLGSLDYMKAVREVVSLPILRKDFIVHPYQVYESRAAGADCILLIVAILDDRLLGELHDLARSLAMDVLVEVHTEEELKRALGIDAAIIGINNRDLNTFKTDLGTTKRLAAMVDDGITIVAESGIKTATDIEVLLAAGADAFLIGEALMREGDVGEKLKELRLVGA